MSPDPHKAMQDIINELVIVQMAGEAAGLSVPDAAAAVRTHMRQALADFKLAVIDEVLDSQRATTETLGRLLAMRGPQ